LAVDLEITIGQTVTWILHKLPEDENTSATWIFNVIKLRASLSELIPFQLDLQWLDEDEAPTVLNDIKESSILIFEKTGFS
jgi:hypothetical protein